nr:hypothetical protein [Candidatus Freyarchaeota archaeon]
MSRKRVIEDIFSDLTKEQKTQKLRNIAYTIATAGNIKIKQKKAKKAKQKTQSNNENDTNYGIDQKTAVTELINALIEADSSLPDIAIHAAYKAKLRNLRICFNVRFFLKVREDALGSYLSWCKIRTMEASDFEKVTHGRILDIFEREATQKKEAEAEFPGYMEPRSKREEEEEIEEE